MTAKKAVTATISVLLAGALITAGVIFLPKMLNPADPTNTSGVSDTQTPSGTETPDNTPGATDPMPDDTTEPSTPDTSETPTATEKPKYLYPPYDDDYKAFIDGEIVRLNGVADFDIDNALDRAYEKYSQYLNVNISKDAVKAALNSREMSSYVHGKAPQWNICGISPDAVAKVNEFLLNNGEEPIGITDEDLLKTHNELMWNVGMKPFPAILTPEENVIAFWFAASLFYDPTYDGGSIRPCLDITYALAQVMADPSKDETVEISDYIWSDFAKLYGTFDDYGAAIVLANP